MPFAKGNGLAGRLARTGNHYILAEGFEPLSVLLHNGNGNMPCLAGVYISYGTGFSCMRAANNLTLVAVL